MFETITALDIGSSSVKLLTVKTGLKNFSITSMSYEDIDISIENDDEATVLAINNLLKENDLSGHVILSNMPMDRTIIRNISFPFSDVEKIAEAIPFEAEENIPFKIEDLSMDFQSLYSPVKTEGRVMLVAAPREKIQQRLKTIEECKLQPSKLGIDANAMFECYRYFNTVSEETVVILNIGHGNSIINIVQGNHLLYTRSINSGISTIHEKLASMKKTGLAEARKLFENLSIDLTSLENNYQKELYKTFKLSKPQLKNIYQVSQDTITQITEEIILTLKSFTVDYGEIEYSRILITGGGTNINGIGHLLSRELEVPVVSLPFLEEYTEQQIQTQFPVCFGIVLDYINRKNSSVNLLKGEFIPDMASGTRKIYFLAAFFGILTIFIVLINLALSMIMEYRSNRQYTTVLQQRYRKYFHPATLPDDPIKSARKRIIDEKKELGSIDAVIQSDEKILNLLKEILRHFPKSSDFKLKNLVINERVIRIDGSLSTIQNIVDFRKKLFETKQFEAVDLNTNIRKGNQVNFKMIIKQKVSESQKSVKGKK